MSIAEMNHVTTREKNKMSELIKEGVNLQKKIEKYQARQKELESELMPLMKHLAGDKMSSQMGVDGGRAEYKRDDDIVFVPALTSTKNTSIKGWIFGEDIALVRKACGPRFDELYTPASVYKPKTSQIRDLIADADNVIGKKLSELTTLSTKETVKFRVN